MSPPYRSIADQRRWWPTERCPDSWELPALRDALAPKRSSSKIGSAATALLELEAERNKLADRKRSRDTKRFGRLKHPATLTISSSSDSPYMRSCKFARISRARKEQNMLTGFCEACFFARTAFHSLKPQMRGFMSLAMPGRLKRHRLFYLRKPKARTRRKTIRIYEGRQDEFRSSTHQDGR